MGISAFTAEWLIREYERGVFGGRRKLAEFGPQELTMCRNYMKYAATRLYDTPEFAYAFYDRVFPPGSASSAKNGQKTFYSSLGIVEYKSFDYYDSASDYPVDFNYVVNMRERFDIITNFGTSEHIANIGATFFSMHNLLNIGGLLVFILPSMGDINHGFFNIHPIFFKAFADWNKYEIVDYLYVDHALKRALMCENDPRGQEAFDDLLKVEYNNDFIEKVEDRFFENTRREKENAASHKEFLRVYDHSYVILEKRENSRFVWPAQQF